ncbi:hypothetical protein [Streptomyces sp. G1]|uniref:hypothetical protein n=1 Tax=Streptomyces sp. G1 TaxID=361572 RepID=UPI0020309723|nr:hypothetical protein [Streptomyces sp. G1]MCM1970682.1 hypothetical protein [Streptomyces sp. G1]
MEVKRRRGIDTTRPPAWLARLELSMPPARLAAVSGGFAFLVGAMVSGVLSQWLFLPGLLLALGLLWFIAVNTDQRLRLMAPFLFATFALVGFAGGMGHQQRLAEQGRPGSTALAVTLWTVLAVAELVLTTCVARSALRGVRWLHHLRAMEPPAPAPAPVPPPPSSPPPVVRQHQP